jgi:hypothetical protein
MYIILLLISVIIFTLIYLHFKKQNSYPIQIKATSPQKFKKITDTLLLNPVDLTYYLDTAKTTDRYSRNIITPTIELPDEYIVTDIPETMDIYRDIDRDIDILDYDLDEQETQADTIIRRIPNFTIDTQSVHSSSVQDMIKTRYNKIGSKEPITTPVKEQITALSQGLNKDTNKINNIVNQIYTRNAVISNLNSTEVTVLENTWNNSNANVKEQILNELLNTVERGNTIVCPTGVVTRIINATTIENPEIAPKTENMLREEMLNTANRVRTDLENTPEYKALPEEQQKSKLKETLKERYSKDYQGIISSSIVQKELDTWVEYI